MKVSFAPLEDDARALLVERTGMDFSFVDFSLDNWLSVTAREGSAILGVMTVEFPLWFNADVTLAIEDPRCVTRRLMHALFTTMFSRAVRVSAQADPENERATSFIRDLGFRYEGFKRLGMDGQRDAMMFGMLRHECRWIMPAKENGRVETAIAA
jgi:hypothetical protein